MQEILVLEDNQALAETLKSSLASRQLAVTAVTSLREFYAAINRKHYALCVMDRLIGGDDSIEVIPEVRETLPQAKILFLSKKAAVIDRVNGLEAGADDYLAKPFSMAELRLRVRSLLSLHRIESESYGLVVGELMLYPQQGALDTPDGKILLRRRETEILAYLARAAGAIVSRTTLERALWPEAFEPNPSTIDVYIRRLRQKLGHYGSILQTKRGFGYYLTPAKRKL